MGISYDEAAALVCAPGQPFEITEAEVLGQTTTLFANCRPNLRELFDSARERGDATFLVYEDERWSFADVMARVDALGALLVDTYGVGKGDRVAIGMRNYPEWIVSFAAILSVGAVSVSLNAWWTEDELDYALDDSGATVLIADAERAQRALAPAKRLGVRLLAVRADEVPDGVDRWDDVLPLGARLPDVEIDPDDDATILYTSGTTGRPKGAVSTHRAILQALMGFGCRAAIDRVRKGDAAPAPLEHPPAFILIVPLFHVTGCVPVMLGCFSSGTKLVIMYKWDPDRALELIERERVTNFVGVPTQSWDLLESPRFAEFDTSSLLSVGGGGAPAPPELVKRVESTFTKGRPNIGYGLTETNSFGPGNSGDDYVSHPTSTGRGMPNLEIEIRDPDSKPLPVGERGEIYLRCPNLFRGYWNKPEATAETLVDGWLRTGDLGRLDDEGFLYIEDRAKDMILRAGENVYCTEVEAALYEHPAIYEASVFGLSHPRLGEEVAAAIVLKPGATATPDELRAFVGERLAGFKVPSHVELRTEALPRNASGKIMKRELREAVEAGRR